MKADPMVAPAYARALAAYNSEMNRRIYAAAARLSDDEGRADRGAFWGSIHGTLAHLLWGDTVWLARFGVGEDLGVPIRDSAGFVADFGALAARRMATDATIEAWARDMAPADLEGDLAWLSGATGRRMVRPRALCVIQLFNHQTHHRGQVHALLTRAGEGTGDTDLPFVLSAAAFEPNEPPGRSDSQA